MALLVRFVQILLDLDASFLSPVIMVVFPPPGRKRRGEGEALHNGEMCALLLDRLGERKEIFLGFLLNCLQLKVCQSDIFWSPVRFKESVWISPNFRELKR